MKNEFEVGYWQDSVGHWEQRFFATLEAAKNYAVKIDPSVHYWYVYGPRYYISKYHLKQEELQTPEAWPE